MGRSLPTITLTEVETVDILKI
eukprot:COSAG01_NODE_32453_length_590_cov_0.643154_2_plen_21_part_01